MTEQEIKPILKFLVQKLSEQDYETVYRLDKEKRLPVQEIKTAIEDYPGKITNPPEDAYLNFNVYCEEEDDHNPVEFDLWYDEYPSDLTLSVTIYRTCEFSIEDIRIL
jgi:hypothetical protein